MKQLRMSNSEVTEIEEADPYEVAKTIALNALAPRAKSRDELFKHLKKRGTDPEIADSVLDNLELYGFVNDLEFARAWRDSRQRAKKLGKRVIAKELREKGVAAHIITEVVEEIDDDLEYQKAYALAERKFRSISHLESEKIYQRISSLLARKGYGHGITSQIMRELIAH